MQFCRLKWLSRHKCGKAILQVNWFGTRDSIMGIACSCMNMVENSPVASKALLFSPQAENRWGQGKWVFPLCHWTYGIVAPEISDQGLFCICRTVGSSPYYLPTKLIFVVVVVKGGCQAVPHLPRYLIGINTVYCLYTYTRRLPLSKDSRWGTTAWKH